MENLLSSPLLPALAILALAVTACFAVGVEALASFLQVKWRNHQRRKSYAKWKKANRSVYTVLKG